MYEGYLFLKIEPFSLLFCNLIILYYAVYYIVQLVNYCEICQVIFHGVPWKNVRCDLGDGVTVCVWCIRFLDRKINKCSSVQE